MLAKIDGHIGRNPIITLDLLHVLDKLFADGYVLIQLIFDFEADRQSDFLSDEVLFGVAHLRLHES